MEHIIFLDRDTIAPHISIRKPLIKHTWQTFSSTNKDQVVERLATATIAVINKVPLRAKTLAQLPQLKLIAISATGYDCVDMDYCRQHGIAVCNIRGYAVNTVPEHTFSLLLALRRNMIAYRQDVINGDWQRAEQFCFLTHPIRDLANSTLVMIGTGSIGRKVVSIAQAFGMQVLLAERKNSTTVREGYTAWDEALAQADVISIHCPLTPDTHHLLDQAEFEKMRNQPIILNTARGNLVDELALEQALADGLISGIGFDVAAKEPIEADSPLLRLAKQPNVILTPHIAWASDEAQQTLVDQLIDNIEGFVNGQPQHIL